MAEREAVARPGGVIWMGEVIIARDNLKRLVSPSSRMPAPPTPHRAKLSGMNGNIPPFRCRVDPSDEDETERPVWPPCYPHMDFRKR